MASIPFIYSWDVISAPFDEAEIEPFQVFAQVYSGNYFNLMVHVKHQIICITHPRPRPPALIPSYSQFFQSDSSIIASSSQLFENGSSYLRVNFPHPIIPRQLLGRMMPQVIAYAKNLLENYCPSSGLHYESGSFRLFKLVLNIQVEIPHDNMVLEEPSARLKSAVGWPKKGVNLEKGGTQERCSICLVEFTEGVAVSTMPCMHKYHQECITMWLHRSYTCPLCRSPLTCSWTKQRN